MNTIELVWSWDVTLPAEMRLQLPTQAAKSFPTVAIWWLDDRRLRLEGPAFDVLRLASELYAGVSTVHAELAGMALAPGGVEA